MWTNCRGKSMQGLWEIYLRKEYNVVHGRNGDIGGVMSRGSNTKV